MRETIGSAFIRGLKWRGRRIPRFPECRSPTGGQLFSPANQATEPSVTKVDYAGPERVTISTLSSNQLWAARYDFFPTYCTFTMTRMPPDKKYWVLYEGTPGGQFDDSDWWMTSADKTPQSMTVNHEGDIPAPEWIAFGDAKLNRALFLLHHEDDTYADRFYQMEHKMTVFGFGRAGLTKFPWTTCRRSSRSDSWKQPITRKSGARSSGSWTRNHLATSHEKETNHSGFMYSRDFLTGLFRTLCTIRAFETRMCSTLPAGADSWLFSSLPGRGTIATGVCAALEPRDYVVSTHRGHGHCIARGADIRRMVAELFGRASSGYCAGRGGSMHIADVSAGNLGANGIVGGGLSLGLGAALGAAIRGEDRVAVVFFGDGAAMNGVFCETMNLAAIWKVPLIFVIENNQYAVSMPFKQATRNVDLRRRGDAFSVPNWTVDGDNAIGSISERARPSSFAEPGRDLSDRGQNLPPRRPSCE